MWANQMNVNCTDVADDSLTVADLKRAFGSNVVLRVPK